MKIDLTNMKPILENDIYALFVLSQIKDNLFSGIRLNKQTQEQIRVNLQKKPTIRVVDIFNGKSMQHIY